MKAVQYFSQQSLERSKKLSPDQILLFLENFRTLHSRISTPARSKLISLKVPEDLLSAFKFAAEKEGVKYQTKIKELMRASLR